MIAIKLELKNGLFNQLSKLKTIDFVLTNGLKWTEIDDHRDWEIAQNLVNELEKV